MPTVHSSIEVTFLSMLDSSEVTAARRPHLETVSIPKQEWADRPIAISPFLYDPFRSTSPYNIPFVDRTLPANRSSNIVAWSKALANALKMASMM